MSYQAVVRNSSNELVTNQNVGIRIQILQGSESGDAVYSETQIVTTNTNGLLSIEIGGTSAIVELGSFSTIEWLNGPYFVKNEIDPTGGTNYTITGTSQILSVPYAFHAKTADSITGASISKEKYQVGDFALGGIVFWVDETGEHGLVSAKEDQSTGVRWNAGTFGNTQAKGDEPLAGKVNTSIIIAAHVAIGDDGDTYAARICNELKITKDGTTYGDWYLPSKEELNLMYQNKSIIDGTATANGGSAFAIDPYWSSTEIENDGVWVQVFENGIQGYGGKSNTITKVRAVRAF
jgi:hypothetical protein